MSDPEKDPVGAWAGDDDGSEGLRGSADTRDEVYEGEPDGECFRGGEATAYEAEQMDRVQRELKR